MSVAVREDGEPRELVGADQLEVAFSVRDGRHFVSFGADCNDYW